MSSNEKFDIACTNGPSKRDGNLLRKWSSEGYHPHGALSSDCNHRQWVSLKGTSFSPRINLAKSSEL